MQYSDLLELIKSRDDKDGKNYIEVQRRNRRQGSTIVRFSQPDRYQDRQLRSHRQGHAARSPGDEAAQASEVNFARAT